MATRSNPWDRLPDESDAAFAAFCIYRDIGATRTVLGAYSARPGAKSKPRATQGQEKGKLKPKAQSSGRWNAWSKSHRWAARALAFDNHQAQARQKGIDKATEKQGADWAKRRLERAERDWRLAEKLSASAERLAAFPVHRQTTRDADGGVTIIEPIDALDLQRAASLARTAQEIALTALREALPDDDDGFDPTQATIAELQDYIERKTRHRPA